MDNSELAELSSSRPTVKEVMNAFFTKLALGEGVELPESLWSFVPFRQMNFALVRIVQRKTGVRYQAPAQLFKKLASVISNITTWTLVLEADSQQDVKKVMKSISLQREAIVQIYQESEQRPRTPALQYISLSNIEEFMWYTERILSEDLKQVLQSNIKYLRVRAPFPEGDGLYIVAEYLQEFLGGVAAQRHCDFFFRCRELEVIETIYSTFGFPARPSEQD
ncbi:unnamed protein product [Heligmosomoides polygyrus]|uniref:Ras-GEF domain-containing protein n=1 Tax=Heligmosomoides polygyrus TaxID=6339 RepID=A0A183GMG7_HELPZ|nr:unnamed protein product [Heligmosomoides polygyrus]